MTRLFSELNTEFTKSTILNKLADGNRKTSAKEFVMFLYSLSTSANDLKSSRNHLSTKFPGVSRSHIAEALASALGFNTSIALQTAIKNNPPYEKRYTYFDTDKFVKRLGQLSHVINESTHGDFLNDMKFPSEACIPFVISSEGVINSKRTLGEHPHRLSKPNTIEIAACKFVLSQITVLKKTRCKDYDSYWFKQRIEEAFGIYVSNGAFIQAAAELGLQIKTFDSLNAQFYFGKKVLLKAIEDALSNGAREAVQNLKFSHLPKSELLI